MILSRENQTGQKVRTLWSLPPVSESQTALLIVGDHYLRVRRGTTRQNGEMKPSERNCFVRINIEPSLDRRSTDRHFGGTVT
jgi:hypothetical protein